MLSTVRRPSHRGWLVLVLPCLFVVGCNTEEGVKTYKVASPDEKGKSAEKKGLGDKPLTWSVPEGWKEGPAKQFRIVTLQKEAVPDLYLSDPFAGSLLDNVNRWRKGDAGIDAVSEADLPKSLTEIKLGTVNAYRVDIRGPGPKGDGKVRLLGGIIPAGDGSSYFVKFVGPAEKIDANEKDFDAFLNSIRVAGGK